MTQEQRRGTTMTKVELSEKIANKWLQEIPFEVMEDIIFAKEFRRLMKLTKTRLLALANEELK